MEITSVADLRNLGLWKLGPEGPVKVAARSAKIFGFEQGETPESMQPTAAIFTLVLRVAYFLIFFSQL